MGGEEKSRVVEPFHFDPAPAPATVVNMAATALAPALAL